MVNKILQCFYYFIVVISSTSYAESSHFCDFTYAYDYCGWEQLFALTRNEGTFHGGFFGVGTRYDNLENSAKFFTLEFGVALQNGEYTSGEWSTGYHSTSYDWLLRVDSCAAIGWHVLDCLDLDLKLGVWLSDYPHSVPISPYFGFGLDYHLSDDVSVIANVKTIFLENTLNFGFRYDFHDVC